MKKIFSIAILASLFVSCQESDLDQPMTPTDSEKNLTTINISANTGASSDSDTKTSITTGADKWEIKWTEGDKLGGHSFTYDDLSGWDTTLYPFEMTTDLSGGDSDLAEFEGSLNTDKKKVRFFAPYKDVKCAGAMPYLSLTKQTVDMSAPYENLDKYLYMVSDQVYDIDGGDFSNITMKHICSVLDFKLNFTNIPEGSTLKEITVEGLGDYSLNFYVQFDFKEEFAAEPTYSGTTMGYTDARSVGTESATITLDNSPELTEGTVYNMPVAMYPARFRSADKKSDFLLLTVKFDVNGEEQVREVKRAWTMSSFFCDVKRGDVQPLSVECNLAKPELPDFTDPDGTFLLFEGNMTDSWGRVVYIDKNGKEWKDIFLAQNNKSVGNVLQDMYIYNDKIYFLTQNGNLMGHGGTASDDAYGRLVVCDKDMKVLYSNAMEFTDPSTGLGTWPQHIVVTADDTAYIQFSTHMETYSGVYKIALDHANEEVTNNGIINGTYGAFTIDGATKARMTLSKNKIFMGRGASFISIDTTNDAVQVIETFENKQVKDVVKAGDGNIYVAVSGEGKSDGEQTSGFINTMTSAASIVSYNQDGTELSTTELNGYSGFDSAYGFPIDTPSPNVGMCASFTAPIVYFRDQPQFSCPTIGRIDFGAQWGVYPEFNTIGETTDDPVYGYLGVHPKTEELYVGYSTNSYTTGLIDVWSNPSGYQWVKKANPSPYSYNDRHHASPAGVDFAYRFTDEWIQK